MTITINNGTGVIGYIDGDGSLTTTYKLSSASQTFSYPTIYLCVSSSYLKNSVYCVLQDLALYRGSTLVDTSSYETWAATGWGTKGSWQKAVWYRNFTVITSSIFTASNRNERVVPYSLWLISGAPSKFTGIDSDGGYTALVNTSQKIRTLNIELDAPPTVTLGTPTYSNPQYAGLGEYSVPVTKAQAQYSGYVQTITLTVGSDSVTQNYSATTVTNQTLSLVPSVAGTYTPTITVTDTRGQVTTVNLEQITVNTYTAPSISFDVQRTNNAGIPNAEGEYGLVTASISYTNAIAKLTQPTVSVRDANGTLVVSSATWYTTWTAQGGVQNAVNWTNYNPQSPATLYAVVSATESTFSPNESYTISITPTDNKGGVAQTITQTLSTGFFTIDFKAGGKEIAFGAPANDSLTGYGNGLFRCDMDAKFNRQIRTSFNSSIAMGSYGSQQQTVEGLVGEVRMSSGCSGSASITTAYTKDGVTIETGWYNYSWLPHRNGGINGNANGDNCNYGNLLLFGMNNTNGRFVVRVSSSNIQEVVRIITTKECIGYIVETGTDNNWKYTKWSNGTYEAKYDAGFALNAGTSWCGGYYHKTTYGLSLPSFSKSAQLVSAIKADGTLSWCVGLSSESDGWHLYWVTGSSAAVSGSSFINTVVTIKGTW